ncbi:hypothetical protein KR222_006969 [Zaprionus bogoriensis]|nr:hypothetical protein KR222_006969 [Zaprionus bogoriensis]
MSVDLRVSGLASNWRLLRLLLDVLLLGGLLILASNFGRLWGTATQRGFFCDDESLMYPYHENTVSSSMLHWLGLYLPLAALLIVDFYRCWSGAQALRWQKILLAYNTLRWFLFGHVAESLIKDMGKLTIGRLRPHFFDVCRPLLTDGGSCTDAEHRQGGVYHMVYTCQPELSGATEEVLRDAHVSFPSGHSSMAFYGLVFIALHLQRIRWAPQGSLLRPLCQLLCVGLASFVGLSRVMDYKHHWSDVVAGSLLGATIALAVVHAAGQEEQRLQQQQRSTEEQHANIKVPRTDAAPPAAAAAAAADEAGTDSGTGTSVQLPHDLCVVTCHSSN